MVIASKGFICHSPAVDGTAGEEEENGMDGVAKADNASSQTKKKRNKKPLRGNKRVFYLLEMVDYKVMKQSKVAGGLLGGLKFARRYNIIKQNLTTQDETL
jgi:hypothetical protein